MRCRLSLLLFCLAVPASTDPGPRWLVLCDKRTDAQVGSTAWEDAPLRADLIDSLRARGWKLRTQYRWGNRVSALPPEGEASLPSCVADGGPVAHGVRVEPTLPAARASRATGVDPATQALKQIWDTMGIEAVRQSLLLSGKHPGSGVRLAMIDSKFAPQHQVLQGIRLADHWDFVDSTPTPWDSLRAGGFSDIHGTSTTGLIASRWEGLPGIAPYASFQLYRAEDNETETTLEEDNLAGAIVRAVDSGAQILSISLGYRYVYADDSGAVFHPWSDYDGRTLVASLAALGAARRNVLVVVAAGNDGRWGARSIGSPADADSILVVGAIASDHQPCGFSSWGPTADGRAKPDLAAFGCTVPVAGAQGATGIELQGNGTSYSTPLVAGFAALAKQLLPGATAMELRAKILASGETAREPTQRTGNGLPDLRRILAVNDILSSTRTHKLPLLWRPGTDPLLFRVSSAQSGGKLELVLSTPSGRIVFRRSGSYQVGASLWNPGNGAAPRPGILLARWSGDYGKGAQVVVVGSP